MEEPWLRGPVEGVIAELQPMVHELVFAREELTALFDRLTDDDVWETPNGVASIGYHVRHCSGSTMRMLTYAQNKSLSDEQFQQMAEEEEANPAITKSRLLAIATTAIDEAIAFAKKTTAAELNEPRKVGRKQLPTNVRGLMYEIAVHTARHVGQIATTAKLLQR
jgi:hypothetical protein